ncbi:MAG: hypothetical protein Ta2B_09420 [Termitinemataceae bacterium]|nr:MAG: hypothetical protein Ta2B_09420 [Termitinemataceae bacterium]
MKDLDNFGKELEELIIKHGVDNYVGMHKVVIAEMVCNMLAKLANPK